jgi:outer membrane protein OmpA-like peptidoglycan-associated protein
MNKKGKRIALGVFLIGALCAATPSTYTSKSPSAIQLYEQATVLYIKKDYVEAKKQLAQALKKDKKFVEAYLQLAKIQQELDDFEEAIQLLCKAQRYVARENYALQYEFAFLYYKSGAYNKAQEVLAQLPTTNVFPATLQYALEHLRENVFFSLEQLKTPLAFNPQLLPSPLNQFASQYFPVLSVDQATLLFTVRSGQSHSRGREDIYVSHKDAEGNWSTPAPLPEKINTEYNEGTCAISADGKMLVFTSCRRPGNYGSCDLYVTQRKEHQWTTPQNLGPRINSKGWESQPSLSADGRTLYFVSEREGNYGKKDIWKSTLQEDGTWADPVNLGKPINSEGREISPFMHPNGQTLFFASDRCPSLGGLDIYYSNWIDGQWTMPVNLGYPINRHKDQISLFITADGKKGYYADGNQKGASYYSSYLYAFDFPESLVRFPKSTLIKLQVADAKTGQAVDAEAEVYDLETGEKYARALVDKEDGTLVVVVNEGKRYGIFLKKKDHLFESIHVDYQQGGAPTISAPSKVLLKPNAVDQSQILENIFFAFDQCTLAPCSTIELDRLVEFLQTHANLRIEIEGHTDKIGTRKYNLQLSIQRAQAIYNYLIAAGIAAERLTYRGYGATLPISSQDMPEGRKLNRRVAFRISGTGKKEKH